MPLPAAALPEATTALVAALQSALTTINAVYTGRVGDGGPPDGHSDWYWAVYRLTDTDLIEPTSGTLGVAQRCVFQVTTAGTDRFMADRNALLAEHVLLDPATAITGTGWRVDAGGRERVSTLRQDDLSGHVWHRRFRMVVTT